MQPQKEKNLSLFNQNEADTSKDIIIKYACQICGPIKSYKSSSALGKHLHVPHRERWKC